jgi:hypothetical protein
LIDIDVNGSRQVIIGFDFRSAVEDRPIGVAGLRVLVRIGIGVEIDRNPGIDLAVVRKGNLLIAVVLGIGVVRV